LLGLQAQRVQAAPVKRKIAVKSAGLIDHGGVAVVR
jgi:hypothetical protein